MTNMKTVLFTDESKASPNNPDGLNEEWVFNGDNCAMGIRRQQSGSVVVIWGGIIANEVTAGFFPVPEELKLSTDMYCSFLKKSNGP